MWDESYDLVVVGSGAASVTSALVLKEAGLSAIIVEKQALFGGTTSLSGGVLWIPCNYLLADRDDPAEARTYLDALIGAAGPASSPARRDAFLREAPRVIDCLRRHGMRFMDDEVADYYHGIHPGALRQGRAIVPVLFDMRRIGGWMESFGESWRSPGLPISSHEIAALLVARRTWKGRLTALRLAWRILLERLTGRKLRGGGRALQAAMLEIALRENVPVSMETEVRDLASEEGRVVGIVAQRGGRTVRIAARRGVLLNAGGFSRNEEMRRRFIPKVASAQWSQANPGETGECIRMGLELGAASDLMDSAWWVPTGMPVDSSKPHFIVVNQAGQRFCNEGAAYMETGQILLAQDSLPVFGIFDSHFRTRYTLASLMLQPHGSEAPHIESGLLLKAETLEELATRLGIDRAGLARTVERFNAFCRTGIDEDFRKGDFAYNRHFADLSNRPNPCLGSIARPPFYAIRIWPSDIGTCGGLLTDEHARVLRIDGSIIPGLYATGNCAASVMGGHYPGAGSTIGPSLTFGYIAANHVAGVQPGAA